MLKFADGFKHDFVIQYSAIKIRYYIEACDSRPNPQLAIRIS